MDDATDRVAHFQFLLTNEDRTRIKQVLPWSIFRNCLGPDAAWQEWVYTFSDCRNRGYSVLATEHVIRYCRDHGIAFLYSRRGTMNLASVRMADRIGYAQIAQVYHVQVLWQSQERGWHLIRKI
jgi:L-amino acid N-acyltransferase YncA